MLLPAAENARMGGQTSSRIVRTALLFEGGLGLLAVLIGWLGGHSPFVGMTANLQTRDVVTAIGWGLVGTGPLLVALVAMDGMTWEPIRELRELAGNAMLRMFSEATAPQLAAISLIAGMGEELLFRGLVQGGVARLVGGPAGVVVAVILASVLFGVCHWLNATYAVLAMLAGAYFGLLLVASGNILTPIVAHAAYDFVALTHLVQPERLVGSED